MLPNIKIISKVDTFEIERLLIKEGKLQPVSFNVLNKFTQTEISNFCALNGIYQIFTTELIEWLRNEIGDNVAIEIGAGNGCLGRALSIPMYDNFMQTWAEIKGYYQMLGQKTVAYGNDVINADANDIIKNKRPEIVVAAWVTQKWQPHYKEGVHEGNMFGVDETKFKTRIRKYIHIGNENTHGAKEILGLYPHKAFHFPWLISRSMARDKNVIYVFNF